MIEWIVRMGWRVTTDLTLLKEYQDCKDWIEMKDSSGGRYRMLAIESEIKLTKYIKPELKRRGFL